MVPPVILEILLPAKESQIWNLPIPQLVLIIIISSSIGIIIIVFCYVKNVNCSKNFAYELNEWSLIPSVGFCWVIKGSFIWKERKIFWKT